MTPVDWVSGATRIDKTGSKPQCGNGSTLNEPQAPNILSDVAIGISLPPCNLAAALLSSPVPSYPLRYPDVLSPTPGRSGATIEINTYYC